MIDSCHHTNHRSGVHRRQQISICGGDIKPLSRGSRFGSTSVMSLLGDLAKKLTLRVLLVLGIVDVDRHVDKIVLERVDDLLIGENGRTARNTVVSDTA